MSNIRTVLRNRIQLDTCKRLAQPLHRGASVVITKNRENRLHADLRFDIRSTARLRSHRANVIAHFVYAQGFFATLTIAGRSRRSLTL